MWLLAESELSQRVTTTLYSCDPVDRCALRYLCLLLRRELDVGSSLHWLLCHDAPDGLVLVSYGREVYFLR